jgi:transcriptional regulator with XRE-family HTH domain
VAKGKYQEWIEPNGILRLTAWKRDGLTDEQIAKNMGIHVSTLYKWQNEYNEISEALKSGKEVADITVENALFKRATGYTYQEITQERTPIRDDDGKIIDYELQVTKVVHKEVVPDTTAQIFWLQNRKSNEWKDRRNLEMTGKDGGDIKISLIGV